MIIAVDTGGTKTLVTAFTSVGKVVEQFQFPTPKDTHDYVELVCEKLAESFSGKRVEAVAFAIPGIVKNGVAIWCNNLKWKNFDVKAAFQGILGNVPIYVENDANLAGLAETRELDPVPHFSLYVTVSTGIGSGIIIDGNIHPALENSEAGRTHLEYDGKMREWETFASGKAIKNAYGKYARDIKSERIWHQVADRISRGFLAIIPVLQPDVIIIGGSIGTYYTHYHKDLQGLLNEHLPDHIPTPKLIQAKHPEHAVVYGCYHYAKDHLSHR